MPQSTMADDERDVYSDGDPATNGCKTLWLGDVQPDWTEEYVESLFSSVGQDLEVKLIRDRHRGVVAGYGFIDFRSHEIAQLVLDTLNGKPIEGTSLRYRLNWGAGGKRIEQAPEYSLFVGDLSPEVTDADIKQIFLEKFPSVLGAKVVTNPMTGSSKSFGFVRFSDERERDEALTVMNGVECCGRPIRVAPATKRSVVPGPIGAHSTDPSNTTVFVGGVNETVTEKVLRDTFSCAGEILTVTTPPGRGCAFITFAHRSSAEHVIYNMQGTTVCGSCLRLSWGKSGRADRDRDRDRANEVLGGMGGVIQSPTAAAAAAAAAARGAQYSGLYGHPPSYASYNGYPTNLYPTVFGNTYGAQQPGIPQGTPGSQLPQAQRQQQQAQQPGQQAQQAQQQYPQTYSPQSYAPYQGFGFQQYPGQAYTNFGGANATYAQDPGALGTDIPQLGLGAGGANTVGGVGNISGAGGRAARVAATMRGGMYGPTRAGPGPSFSLQDMRKQGPSAASRN